MLSYLHEFHAGNHADILKHFALTFVISSLNKKDKPYTFFDTHSASGLYDLLDNRSLKTEEASNGIEKLLSQENLAAINEIDSESFQLYIKTAREYLKNNLYAGSPELERIFMREQDFLVLSELHPVEIENLKKNIRRKENNPSIQIHHRNGWEMITALTPPKTKRGAVLIDPSYEEKQDYIDAANSIIKINQKWSNGIILLWYPLLAHRENEINLMKENIINGVKTNNQNTDICDLMLCINKKDAHQEVSLKEYEAAKNAGDLGKKNPPRLYGSGILVINAPWKMEEEASKVIKLCENILQSAQKDA